MKKHLRTLRYLVYTIVITSLAAYGFAGLLAIILQRTPQRGAQKETVAPHWLALNDPIDGMVSDSKQQPRFRGVATTSGTLDALPTAQQQTAFTSAMTDRNITSTLSTTTIIHIDKDGTALHESNACVGGRILIIGKQGVWHCLIPWAPVTRPLIWPNP